MKPFYSYENMDNKIILKNLNLLFYSKAYIRRPQLKKGYLDL